MKYYEVKRRRTVGGYISIGRYAKKEDAVQRLAREAEFTGTPYDGGDLLVVGHSSHDNIRYIITEETLN